MLKIGREVHETRSEISALKIWNGCGAARLLASDPVHAALLLERVEPGRMLADVAGNDAAATLIAADLLRKLWRPAPVDHELRRLQNWCDAFERTRPAMINGQTSFPVELFRHADRTRAELLASTTADMVLHGTCTISTC